MNPISAFFVRNIILVFFLYGLAFFAMGMALVLASRRASEFRFVEAIRPLAAFGILHGIHEWIEMFQKIATIASGYTPTILHEAIRLIILALSFSMLSAFGIRLLISEKREDQRVFVFVLAMVGLWLLSVIVIAVQFKPTSGETIALADVLSRYSLGIPAGLLGAWALMIQQRTFREHGMPRFGRDLVWCATALFAYGVIGQLFVRPTSLAPSNVLNSALFLQWFGVPVQLFRGIMATVIAVFMLRALNAFELESQIRLEVANDAKLQAQTAALEAERRTSREMERLNRELQQIADELSLLLNLSNSLATSMSLDDRLHSVLAEIVHNLNFPDVGMIFLIRRKTRTLDISTAIGCNERENLFSSAQELGKKCAARNVAMCQHSDGTVIEFTLDEAVKREECRRYTSPVTMMSLPLSARGQVIGSLVLCRRQAKHETNPSQDELKLMVGIAQQLGLYIENARLYQEAQEREKLLGNLLHQAVSAQETERQRIARELHDATGSSLTAIALGLRGAEVILDNDPATAAKQIGELKSFTTDALGELRHLISDLRPSHLDDLGLVAALQWYIQQFEIRYGIQTNFVVEGNPIRLSSEYATVLFRITQEALTNIGKHAQASHATINLDIRPSQICVTVHDDGKGFNLDQVLRQDSTHIGWGLLGIQERASLLGGQAEIESEPGSGTCIRVQVPLLAEARYVKDTSVVG